MSLAFASRPQIAPAIPVVPLRHLTDERLGATGATSGQVSLWIVPAGPHEHAFNSIDDATNFRDTFDRLAAGRSRPAVGKERPI